MLHLREDLLERKSRKMPTMRKRSLSIVGILAFFTLALGALCPVLLAQSPSCPLGQLPYRITRDNTGNLHDSACLDPATGQITWIWAPTASGANTTLSNLGTTAINSDLIFGYDNANLKGHSGGTLNFNAGAVSITAGGTNKNVTITASGTGQVTTPDTINAGGFVYGSRFIATSAQGFALNNCASGYSCGMEGGGTGNDVMVIAEGTGAHVGVNRGFAIQNSTVTCAASLTLDVSAASIFTVPLSCTVTSLSFSNPPSGRGEKVTVIWEQDATGSWAVSGVNANIHGFTAPGLTASERSVQVFDWNNTDWTGEPAGTNIP